VSMSKLSIKEQSGCRKLLRLLALDDLFALKDTVTNRLIAVESTQEAIEAIITYSQDAEELLKRKKVHREVIFKYLANEGVAVLPNSEKQQLIRRTIEYWSSGETGFVDQGHIYLESDHILNIDVMHCILPCLDAQLIYLWIA
uniref:Chromosome 3 open reading frame 38 n=1 Tax=Cyprinus carpio TaxID=7962 RepID=A0A8C2G5T5_CYPCA